MKATSTTLLIAALLIGFAVGAVVGRSLLAPRPPRPAPVPAPVVVAVEQPPAGEAAGEALRRQIADLERSLSYRMEQISELQHAVAQHFPLTDKCAHDENAHFHCLRTPQDIGRHQRPVLGEGIW